jgi:hypothetical protein
MLELRSLRELAKKGQMTHWKKRKWKKRGSASIVKTSDRLSSWVQIKVAFCCCRFDGRHNFGEPVWDRFKGSREGRIIVFTAKRLVTIVYDYICDWVVITTCWGCKEGIHCSACCAMLTSWQKVIPVTQDRRVSYNQPIRSRCCANATLAVKKL